MNVMEAIWTLLELDTAGLAAEESGAGGRVGDGEALRVLGTAQVLAQHQAGAAVVPGGARPLTPVVLVIAPPALVHTGVALGGVAGGGAALLPPPSIHRAVMSPVSRRHAGVQAQLPVHTHGLSGL